MKPIVFVACLFLVLLTFESKANAQEQSLDEFKEYVAGKTNGQVSDSKLAEIAKLVDKDGDGKISEAEFEDRMDAFQKVMSGEDESVPEEADANEKQEVVVVPALTDSSDVTVLLVTADELAEAWQPFAHWKTSNGKLTSIVTVGQIEDAYEADSIQEKIRLCVRDHIDNHKTQWVILGGDCLPGGKGLVPGGHMTVHRGEPDGIPTDIVYLSPTNWDADGDGIYGEFKDDREAITYPDGSVGLGRIPVRTVEDVAAFTAKVLSYESEYPTDSFAKNMIYTCTDQPAYPKVRNSWDGYVSKSWNGEMGRFFSKETPWDEEDKPGSFPLSAENLVNLLNRKSTGKLHIHGHGHLPAWVLEESAFTEQHVGQLKNKAAYPLITTVSCNTGEYDSKQDPSIVEQLLRRPNAGSVAVVAPIRTGKAHFARQSDFRLMVSEGKLDGTTLTMTRYWVHGLGDSATTGHAMMKAKNEMAEDAAASPSYHLCVCELNLLGDPTLDMRAEAPRQAEVGISTETNGEKVSVSVKSDAPGSTICLWNEKNEYHTVTADDEGDGKFVVETSGRYLVSVSGANLNSSIKTVEVK